MRAFLCAVVTAMLLLGGGGVSAAQGQAADPPSSPDQQTAVAVSQSGSSNRAQLSSANLARLSVLTTLVHRATDATPMRVSNVAISPDGQVVATAANDLLFRMDPTVKLWDLASGTEKATLAGHKGWILGLAYSRDGRWVASAGSDGTVRLWDASTGRELRSFSWPAWVWADSVAISPDGRVIASGGADGTVRSWDTETGAALHVMGEPAWTWVYGVAFSPDGKQLVSGGVDGSVTVWNVATGAMVSKFDHGNTVPTVAFTSDGKSVVSGSRDGKLKEWSLLSGQEVRTIDAGSRIYNFGLSPDGEMVVAALASRPGGETVGVWDLATGNRLASLAGLRLWANSATFSVDGALLVAGGDGGDVKVWGVSSPAY